MIALILTGALFAIGGVACVIAGIGLHRFPDVYTRMHAAGVADTLGVIGILGGLMAWSLVGDGGALAAWSAHDTAGLSASLRLVAKLASIGVFLWVTGPVASHALARAAWLSGLAPLEAPPEEGEPSTR